MGDIGQYFSRLRMAMASLLYLIACPMSSGISLNLAERRAFKGNGITYQSDKRSSSVLPMFNLGSLRLTSPTLLRIEIVYPQIVGNRSTPVAVGEQTWPTPPLHQCGNKVTVCRTGVLP